MEDQKKKTSYTESQKKAILKYRENNRDKINNQRKKYYEERKKNDNEFMEYKRVKAREYYQRKKNIDKEPELPPTAPPTPPSPPVPIQEQPIKTESKQMSEVKPIQTDIKQPPTNDKTPKKKTYKELKNSKKA